MSHTPTEEGSSTRKEGDGRVCIYALIGWAGTIASSAVSYDSFSAFGIKGLCDSDNNSQTHYHSVIECDIISYATGISSLWIWLSNISKALKLSPAALGLFNVCITPLFCVCMFKTDNQITACISCGDFSDYIVTRRTSIINLLCSSDYCSKV